MRAAPLPARRPRRNSPPTPAKTTKPQRPLGARAAPRRDPVAEKPSADDIARPVATEIGTREPNRDDDRDREERRPAQRRDEERDPRDVTAGECESGWQVEVRENVDGTPKILAGRRLRDRRPQEELDRHDDDEQQPDPPVAPASASPHDRDAERDGAPDLGPPEGADDRRADVEP